ncbi:hypothetical protein ACQPW3_10520 [Actinosynnema sp. CA-248983]
MELLTAVIAAVVALATTLLAQPLRFLADRALYRGQISTQYRQDRLKEINEVVGEHLGPLLEAAEAFDHRMHNMYRRPESREWLTLDGDYDRPSYYLDTTVSRFLAVITVVRRFEVRALHIDPRVVRRDAFTFVAYGKSMRWTMTNVDLVAGLGYDPSRAADHFFADRLRSIADQVTAAGRVDVAELKASLDPDSAPWAVWRFFDGVSANEQRLRWDRLVAFHLVVMLFLRAYGYPMQRPSPKQVRAVVRKVRNPEVVANLRTWLRRHGVDRSATRLLRHPGGTPRA